MITQQPLNNTGTSKLIWHINAQNEGKNIKDNTLNPYSITLSQTINTLKNIQKIAPNTCISGKGNGFIKFEEVNK